MSAEQFASFMPDGRMPSTGDPYWKFEQNNGGRIVWDQAREVYVVTHVEHLVNLTQHQAEGLVVAWQRAFTWQLAVNQSNKVMRMQVKRNPDGGMTADVMGYPIDLSPSLVAYLELENEDLDLKEKP